MQTRRTTIDEPARDRMRALADDGWSLRRIARELGVSHETVRTVIRGDDGDDAAFLSSDAPIHRAEERERAVLREADPVGSVV